MNRPRIAIGIATFHLTIVFLSVFFFNWNGSGFGLAAKVLNYYGTLTGAVYRYGFFTPRVPNQARIVFDLYSHTSKTESIEFTDSGLTEEAKIRFGDIVTTFFHESISAKVETVSDSQRFFLRFLGERALARFPNASKISIRLERFKPVSIDQYREGARPEWTLIQQFDFERGLWGKPHG